MPVAGDDAGVGERAIGDGLVRIRGAGYGLRRLLLRVFGMREFLRVFGAFAIVMLCFYTTVFSMDHFRSACGQNRTALRQPFLKQGVFSFFAYVPELIDLSDTAEAPARSPYLLCEGNRILGPAHSHHVEISEKGAGRLSHAGTGFYFSSSNNSDPNTNGRNYYIVKP